MNITESIEKLAARLSEALPESPKLLKKDLEKNFRAILESGFAKLDLVTREEFDIQVKVLERCRARIRELEKLLKSTESGK